MKRVSAGILKNGFRFYTQFDARAHVSGVGIVCGSIQDPHSQRGLCHLTEHILGGYTEDEELKFEEYECGPDENVNIRTDWDSTFYGHDLVITRGAMYDLFDIIAKRLLNPKVSREELLTEKAAVLNEYYLRGIDVMEILITDLLHEAMYERNPVRNRIDCVPEELKAITLSDVRRFIRKHYVPNNMFAVILGPPFQKAKRVVERYFGELESAPVPDPTHGIAEKYPTIKDVKTLEIERRGIHQYHVAVGFPTEPFGKNDDIAIDLLREIWSWRLRRVLRDQNQTWGNGVYRAPAETIRSYAHGMIYVTFATPSETYAREGVERIIRECESLKTKWVTEKELNAMSNKLYHGYIDAFNYSPGRLAEMIINSACNGDEEMRLLNSFLGRLGRVGKKCLLRIANTYFTTPHAYVHAVIKPIPD